MSSICPPGKQNYDEDRNKKIEAYLTENLPDSEERIPIPMNPACEVCVIIPAYDERKYILLPLESLTRQNNVTPDQDPVISAYFELEVLRRCFEPGSPDPPNT